MRIRGYCLTKIWMSFWIATFFFTGSMTVDANEANNWGVTRINAHRINYTWTIDNYSLNNLKTGDHLSSPIFSGDQSNKYKWQIELYPKGIKEDVNDYVSLLLSLKSGGTVTAFLEFHVIDSDGKIAKSISFSEPKSFTNYNNKWGWKTFMSHRYLIDKKNLLHNDSLTILAEIVVREEITKISGHCRFSNNTSTNEQMAMLLENDFLSDVQVRVSGETIKGHRAILATHSSWFFQEFTKNPNLDAVQLENTTIVAAKQALSFMYTGKVNITEDTAEELLSLSNKLGIPQLTIMCEEVLCKSMNPTNAVDVLMLAELHDAENLKREAANYIAAHAASVSDSSSFEKLEKSYPNPLYGVLRAMVKKEKN